MVASMYELKELAMNRARLYSFLSRIYREEVSKESLHAMKQSSSKPINIEDPELARGYSELRNFLEKIEVNDELVENLAADYASLFLGIGRHPAHPYESVYLSKEGIVMREPWIDVLKTYRKEGLKKVEWFKEPEDQIAIELEFMVYLCLKTKEALDNDNVNRALRFTNIQEEFLCKHLKSWIPKFCEDTMKGLTKYDFYKAIGTITKRYVLLEEETVAQLKKELRNQVTK